MALTDFFAQTGVLIQKITLENDPDPMFVTLGLRREPIDTPTLAHVNEASDILRGLLDVCMTEDYTVRSATLRYNDTLLPGPANIVIEGTDWNSTGNVVGPPVTQNTATLIRKLSGDAGRGANGRMYVPGVPEAEVDPAGNLSPAFIANVQSELDTLPGLFLAADWLMCIQHHGPEPEYDVEAPGSIIQLVCDPLVATQRRRLR